MKAAFLGGGSLRLIPVLRGIFHNVPEVFRDGEIRLLDRVVPRAEAVGKLLAACPEYKKVGCRILWTSDAEKALENVDVLYLTMGARTEPRETMAARLASEYGFYSSDQLSVNGAFLSMRIGFSILEYAKMLERLAPRAWMLIFANPVAVYSNMVNLHTKIKALGICGGYNNHRWDLTRLCFGENRLDPDWNVIASGVNHLSYILRGDYKGEDLYGSLFPRLLNKDWKPMEPVGNDDEAKYYYRKNLEQLHAFYRQYESMVFSTESDGLAHILSADALEMQTRRLRRLENEDLETLGERQKQGLDAHFARVADAAGSPESVDWGQGWPGNLLFGRDDTDVSIRVLKGIAGLEKMRIIASAPNRGAVNGFSDERALEYTFDLLNDQMVPVENQYIPQPFHELTDALSRFQTLLADSIARRDPVCFAEALEAYPVNKGKPERHDFFRKMFALYSDIDPVMGQAVRHVR